MAGTNQPYPAYAQAQTKNNGLGAADPWVQARDVLDQHEVAASGRSQVYPHHVGHDSHLITWRFSQAKKEVPVPGQNVNFGRCQAS